MYMTAGTASPADGVRVLFSVMRFSGAILLCTLLISGLGAGNARAVVLHALGEPNEAEWTDRPSASVIGRWGGFGCVIAISHNCVVTTRHQSYSPSIFVRIDGGSYKVEEIWEHPSADLRVVKLRGAHLRDFVEIYHLRRESGKEVVIAGYGNGRAERLISNGIPYGYAWDGQPNITLRMGTNRIERTEQDSAIETLVSDILLADFDMLETGDATDYECSPARYDSGGGWFIKHRGSWKLAGLSRGVEVHYEFGREDDPDYVIWESWFRDRDNPETEEPDLIDAVRLSSYADWIRSVVPATAAGDFTADGFINFADAAVFAMYYGDNDCKSPAFCAGADSDQDGDVDFADFMRFAQQWLNGGDQ